MIEFLQLYILFYTLKQLSNTLLFFKLLFFFRLGSTLLVIYEKSIAYFYRRCYGNYHCCLISNLFYLFNIYLNS